MNPHRAGEVEGEVEAAPAQEIERVERSLLFVATAMRLAVIAHHAPAMTGSLRDRRLRFRAGAVTTLVLGEAVWAARRQWRRGRAADRGAAWADAATLALVAIVFTPGVPLDQRTTAANWPRIYAAGAVPFLGLALETPADAAGAALLVAGTHFCAMTGFRHRISASLPSCLDIAANLLGFVAAAGVFRRIARDLAASRVAGVELAAAVATDSERLDRFREVHDSALQTFGAVADGLVVDPTALARRAALELSMLHSAAGVDPSPTRQGLAAAFEAMRAEYAMFGLDIDVCVPFGSPLSDQYAADALVAAVREALNNIVRHADVDRAAIDVEHLDGRLSVCITDCGRGFDPQTTERGTGLALSIHARLEEIGGKALVDSRPGAGTTVRLEVLVDA